MRRKLTLERLEQLMLAIAESYRSRKPARVFVVGGGTAVWFGWRASTIDADLFSADAGVFANVQELKERLQLNIEFARPEDFVPGLDETESRHLFIRTIGKVSFFHYDPYAQVLSKVVRGFRQDLLDATDFVSDGLVSPALLQDLVEAIPNSEFQRYPALSRDAVLGAVNDFIRLLASPSS